ncbi:MAG: riboflavin biosynthesis protein RibF [Candidatus Edwardsbacteria bacterium]|nr:riboflavin biosynthesis protein RibF [Candidatus Edwardsbacteria bacterium]
MLITKRLRAHLAPHRRSIVAFGVFDGLHRGHRALIGLLTARARRRRAVSVVLTFEPHPQSVLGRRPWPMILTTLAEKEALLAGMGVDVLGIIRFSARTAATDPAAFVRRILVDRLAATEVICGEDCGFGKDRGGDLRLLRSLGDDAGFTVTALRPLANRAGKVSSTGIRRDLLAGELAAANRVLGRPYRLLGTIVPGYGIGRTLGYPTANIRLDDAAKLVPADGVYAAAAAIGGRRYSGMLYIGNRPTFGGARRQIEFHAFGARGRLTGRRIAVDLLKYLRPDRAFADAKQLRDAIAADQRRIERYFRRRAAGRGGPAALDSCPARRYNCSTAQPLGPGNQITIDIAKT